MINFSPGLTSSVTGSKQQSLGEQVWQNWVKAVLRRNDSKLRYVYFVNLTVPQASRLWVCLTQNAITPKRKFYPPWSSRWTLRAKQAPNNRTTPVSALPFLLFRCLFPTLCVWKKHLFIFKVKYKVTYSQNSSLGVVFLIGTDTLLAIPSVPL